MYKVEIELNDEKILQEDIYDKEDIYRGIREAFADNNLIEISNNDKTLAFCDTGRNEDYAIIWNVTYELYKAEWFRAYVEKFTWFNSDDAEDDVNYKGENIIEEIENAVIYGADGYVISDVGVKL